MSLLLLFQPQSVAASIQTLTVDGDGTTITGWAAEGGDFTRVQSDDGDTTRLYTPTLNDVRQFSVTNTSGLTGATINSVKVFAKFRSIDPVSNLFQIGIRTNATDYYSTDFDTNPSQAYTLFSNTWTTNPNTAAAWTIADLDALQIGVKKTNAVGGAITYMYAEVSYTAGAAPTTNTQPATARIAKSLTASQPATARITKVIAATQPATARVTTSVTKPQLATARVQKVFTSTQPATSRITKAISNSQPATARVSTTVSKPQTATARIALSVSKPQPATARIAKSFTKTQPATARITASATKAQTATANISSSAFTKAQTATARIIAYGRATQNFLDNPTLWNAGITGGASNTYTVDNSKPYLGANTQHLHIGATGSYIEARSNGSTSYFGTTGFAVKPNTRYRISGTWAATPASGAASGNPLIVDMLTSNTAGTSAGESSLGLGGNTFQDWTNFTYDYVTSSTASTAHIEARIYAHTAPATLLGDFYFANLQVTEVGANQIATGRIAKSITATQPATARVTASLSKPQPATARITAIVTKSQPATARVTKTNSISQPATARIAKSFTKPQTATARVTASVTKPQTATARIAKSFTKTQPATARITASLAKSQTATSRIAKSFTKPQTATANINRLFTKTQTATANLNKRVTKTQTATALIAVPVYITRTKTQTATASILVYGVIYKATAMTLQAPAVTTLLLIAPAPLNLTVIKSSSSVTLQRVQTNIFIMVNKTGT